MSARRARQILIAVALALAALGRALGQAPPPVPSLPDTQRLTQYVISGNTCACSVGFSLYGDSTDYQNWVQVWLNGVQVAYNDPTFGWTITSNTGPLGSIARPVTDGVLTFTNAQTGTVQILGARRPRRVSQFAENRGVPARDLNQAVTDLVAQNREQWDLVNRAILGQPGEVFTSLPTATNRAGRLLAFDGNGLPIVSTPGVGTGNVVGPSSSTNGDLACWNGTSGGLLKDCNTASNDFFFGSGRPWCDVRAHGATGNGSTDDTTAINACITVLQGISGGGGLYFPAGRYCTFTGITVPSAANFAIDVVGEGKYASILTTCNHDVTPLTLNSEFSSVRNMGIAGNGGESIFGLTPSTLFTHTTPALSIGSSCVNCRVVDVISFGGTNALKNAGEDTLVFSSSFGGFYGAANILNVGGALHFIRSQSDPGSQTGDVPAIGSTISARANSTGYSAKTFVTTQGFVIEYTNACTSGGGAPTLTSLGTTFSDGTCTASVQWPANAANVQNDTGGLEPEFSDSDFTGPTTYGIIFTNTGSGTAPSFAKLNSVTIGQTQSTIVDVIAGGSLEIQGSHLGYCSNTSCIGIRLESTAGAHAIINGNDISSVTTGVSIEVSGDNSVIGNTIYSTTTAVNVANSVTGFNIVGNTLDTSNTTAIALGSGVGTCSLAGNIVGSASITGGGTAALCNQIGNGANQNVLLAQIIATSTGNAQFAAINTTFGGSSVFMGQDTSGRGFLYNGANEPLFLGTDNLTRVTILANGNVGIGAETNPQAPVVISANTTTGQPVESSTTLALIAADGNNTIAELDTYGNSPIISYRRADNTAASPSNLSSGDIIGQFQAHPYTNGGFASAASGRITFVYNDSSPNTGTYINFETTAAGSTSRAQALRAMAGVYVGSGSSPTDRGAGWLEAASGFYANGSQGVSCSGTPTSSFASVGGIVTHC